MQGIVFNIKRYAVHDGPGIRTTIFLKGCPLRCSWCHNPESHHPLPESITSTRTLNGKAVPYQKTVGNIMTSDEVMTIILKERIFMEESQGGVTFSGGEPLLQTPFLKSMLQLCSSEMVHTAVDTCGYANTKDFDQIIPHTNLFLFDLKLINEEHHKTHTGVSNKNIIENLKHISQSGVPIQLRFPLIPTITDHPDNIKLITALACELPNIKGISILPYHTFAADKYRRLHLHYQHSQLTAPTAKQVDKTAHYFRQKGITTTIGN